MVNKENKERIGEYMIRIIIFICCILLLSLVGAYFGYCLGLKRKR